MSNPITPTAEIIEGYDPRVLPSEWYTDKTSAGRISRIRTLSINFRDIMLGRGDTQIREDILQRMQDIENTTAPEDREVIDLTNTYKMRGSQKYSIDGRRKDPRVIDLTHFIKMEDGDFVRTEVGEVLFLATGVFELAPDREIQGARVKTLPVFKIDPKDDSKLLARHIVGLRYVITYGEAPQGLMEEAA